MPGRLQAAVEFLVEMVDEQAKSIVPVDRTYAAPLALTVFCWVTLMNAIDLLPVDADPGGRPRARLFDTCARWPRPT